MNTITGPTALRLTRAGRSRNSHVSSFIRRVSMNSPQANQTVKLSDGRLLGFGEYGSKTGYPLLYFHGFPSSRLEACDSDQLARQLDVRLIAPERPGYGLSSPKPGRRITDWPEDIRSLVQHLGISRFAVLGGSGGGPYALACASAFPHNMISAVGMFASAGPWEGGEQDIMRSAKILRWLSINCPVGLRVFLNMVINGSRKIVETKQVRKYLDNVIANSSVKPGFEDADAAFSADEKRERALRTVFEAFAQGAEACVQEARLLSTDWGIKFEDVSYNKVQIWHGTRDVNSPIRLLRYLNDRLPHSELTEYDGNHFSIIEEFQQILSEFITQEERQYHRSLTNT